MNYYDTECTIQGYNACLCTKPADAENARYNDIDAPCVCMETEQD